jgi:alkane 1-monooxygenase
VNHLSFYVGYLLPASLALAWALGPWAWWVPPAFAFVLIPVFDHLLGHDEGHPDERGPQRHPLADLPLFGWVPVQLGLIALITASAAELSTGQLLGWAAATAIISGGGGITVAHELVHRKNKAHRAAAEVLMTSVSYPWFNVEHVLGHHKNVATPLDPATSRLGESVYAFWLRSVTGSLVSAWRLETQRVQGRGLRGLHDRRLRYPVVLATAYGLAFALGGVWGAAWFALQGVLGFTLLEVINYVEHYGLLREQRPSGRYERVRPHHSWNSTHALTNRLLFHLPRHADHHAWASRPYDQLRPWPDAPSLPFGYPTMVLIALLPPLWRAVMDPRVEQQRAHRVAA